MQRDEKHLESRLDDLLQRIASIRIALVGFIYKLENEHQTLTWPSILDSFALISGSLATLSRQLKHERMPILRNYAVLPLMVARDVDHDLEKLTEGRVPMLSHEVMPTLLRTKPEPAVEQKLAQLSAKGSAQQAEVQKQVANLNKCVSSLIDFITRHREDWDQQMNQKMKPPLTFNQADTTTLLAASATGKVFRDARPPQTSPTASPALPTGPMNVQPKPQSMVRTNIKYGSGVHSYQR